MRAMFPGIEQLGFGGLAGACAGYAAKKMARTAAILIGVIFILLQYLAYKNLVAINWDAVEHAARGVTESGAPHSAWAGFWRILTHNLPFGGAFVIGFWIGFKKG